MQLLHERVYDVARFTSLHEQRPLRVFNELGSLVFQNFSSFVGLAFGDAELGGRKAQLSRRFDGAGLVLLRDWVAVLWLSTDLLYNQ